MCALRRFVCEEKAMNRSRAILSVAASAATIVLAVPLLLKPTPHTTPVSVAASIIPRKTITPSPSPTPTAAPILVMSVGDSLTEGHGPNGTITQSYRTELSRLMHLAGVPHTWNIQAVGGTTCAYWAAHLPALLDTYHPAIVFLDCGTNDVPGTNNTEADYRTILAAVAARPGTKIVASLIGRPDPDGTANIPRWPTIDDWMDATNTAIRAALASYPSVPVASTLRVPNNIEWLQSDGIHWTARSEAAVGQLFYQAAAPMRGWPTLAQMGLHEMCGLSGHDRDDPWPTPDVAYPVCRNE
jgi:lysophospholipase L1-like esterase